ncbi:MAG: PKD domain-containing protein [Nocardioides sp.]
MNLPPSSTTRSTRKIAALLCALLTAVGLTTLTPTTAHAAPGVLSYVGGASAAVNASTHRVTVPAAVRPGDALVLLMSTNNITTTIANPAGWTVLQSRDGSSSRGRLWTKTATAADAGAQVTITTSGSAKSALSVAAYRSSLATATVTASASSSGTTSTTTHPAPVVPVAAEGSWLVNAWSEKSSNVVTWTAPATSTARVAATGTGTGKTSSLIADSAGPVPVGTAAGRTATTAPATSQTMRYSFVISPGDDGGVVTNNPPVASFTSNCAGLTCSFNAAGSSDPDGDPLTYSWAFGGGQTGTGISPTNTYPTSGARTVTLTVSDGELTAQSSATVTPQAPANTPGHTALVPDIVSTNMPNITTGEIWDLEYIGDRVFVVGGFTSIQNRVTGNTTTYAQRYVASFNLVTGLVDATFRPTFDGGVQDIEASPDGTKLYVAGTFNTVNGVTKRKFASINPTTGATVTGFTANANNQGSELEATNTTVYLGGRFTTINGVEKRGLAAVDANTGALVGRTTANPSGTWSNNISGGIGPDGALTVQELKLSSDLGTLMVVHTGRQIAGQDRYGVGLIDTASGQLRPWRTRLWEDNLALVGGVQRVYGGDIAPGGDYFLVSSGSGGDRPPINDTIVAFPIAGNDFVQPRWIARHFDSIYGIAASEVAIYAGGHFSWNESPTSRDPWPGLDNVGYGTGQGLSGYGLGDEVVRRDHIGAVSTTQGKALEFNPGSNSFEGDKAVLVHPRGVIFGGDGNTKGGKVVGRLGVFLFANAPAPGANETVITSPIEGRVEEAAVEFQVTGTATATSGVARVDLQIQDRDTNQWLQDDLATWGTSNSISVPVATPGATSTTFSQPLTFAGNENLRVRARTVASNGTTDSSWADNKFETFGTLDAAPRATITGPASPIPSTTFTVTGTATDDFGVRSIGYVIKDSQGRFLQDNGTVGSTYNSFTIAPDVVDAVSTSWSTEVTVPAEGEWRIAVTPRDTAGQSSLDEFVRDWIVSSSGIAPSVTITAPVVMNPPTAAAAFTVSPGQPLTFSGTAVDDEGLNYVEIQLRNTTSRENLAADGTWAADIPAGWHRISPLNLSGTSYNWSYTTPFNLSPGNYTFTVRAVDDVTLTTSTTNQGRLSFAAQVSGDTPPDTLISPAGTVTGLQTLHLDLAGTATDDLGVAQVRVSLEDQKTNRYLRPDGSTGAAFATLQATLASPNATSTGWTLPVDLPTEGDWVVTAYAFDTAGQQDLVSTGAGARYPVFPGDTAPVFGEGLRVPVTGNSFADGRIPFSGRVEDDRQIISVQVAVVDSLGRYMSSTGTFTSTTPSWRGAFVNSPGSPGSNYSYTTPVIPQGTYTTYVRGTDNNGFITDPMPTAIVTVTHPANNPPVANFTVSCTNNICAFDGRSSTDENVTSLVYNWNFGNGTGTGSFVSRTYTSPGTYTVTLTLADEYGLTSTATQTVTIAVPPGNVAPTVVFPAPICGGLSCSFTSSGTADANAGDVITRAWNFGGAGTSTATSPTFLFPAAGTYTVTLTVSDGWGATATATRTVTVAP